MARKKIIAGNWKMNKTPSEAKELVELLKPLVDNPDVDVVYCVPAIDIVPVAEAIKGTNVQLGAENISDQDKGAFTGEISAAMLVDAGVKYVIIGHSERRQYYGEDDAFLNRKVLKALENGLTPILCCGETLEQREEYDTENKYQQRWDKVWADKLCQKYKRRDHADHWLWNNDFYSAPIDDLRYIAALIREV